MFDITLLVLIFFAVLSFGIYHSIKRKITYKPSDVIIGKQVYVHPQTRLYVDVVDFDGKTVFFKLSIESEIAEDQVLSKKEFLQHYRKVIKPSDINSDYDIMTD